jgi:hypothetical protein
MSMRIRPVLALLLLAPFIGEFLLGDFTLRQLWIYPIMLPIYGGGAVLIREAARRSGRGWPTIFLLGLAYGIVEEVLADQSLFNPHVLGLRLIEYGYIPALGISAPWTTYVLAIHVVWSIGVPIALVEALVPERRRDPWVGRKGLAAAGLLYALGVAVVVAGTAKREHFMASRAQLASGAFAAAAVAALAFALFRPAGGSSGPAPAAGPAGPRLPLWLGSLAFAFGSALLLMTGMTAALPPAAVEVGELAALAIPMAVLAYVRRSPGWSDACADAAAVGALLAYCWWGFVVTTSLHGRAGIPGQCLFVAAVVVPLAAIIVRREIRKDA